MDLTTCVLETIQFPSHYNDILVSQAIIEVLAKYNVTANQTSAVVHDKATNACLDDKLS